MTGRSLTAVGNIILPRSPPPGTASAWGRAERPAGSGQGSAGRVRVSCSTGPGASCLRPARTARAKARPLSTRQHFVRIFEERKINLSSSLVVWESVITVGHISSITKGTFTVPTPAHAVVCRGSCCFGSQFWLTITLTSLGCPTRPETEVMGDVKGPYPSEIHLFSGGCGFLRRLRPPFLPRGLELSADGSREMQSRPAAPRWLSAPQSRRCPDRYVRFNVTAAGQWKQSVSWGGLDKSIF